MLACRKVGWSIGIVDLFRAHQVPRLVSVRDQLAAKHRPVGNRLVEQRAAQIIYEFAFAQAGEAKLVNIADHCIQGCEHFRRPR